MIPIFKTGMDSGVAKALQMSRKIRLRLPYGVEPVCQRIKR